MPKLHHFRLLESKTALLLHAGIENCIISACLNPPALFPPAGIQNCIIFCRLESKTALFLHAGI
jgi:hypothetical protein